MDEDTEDIFKMYHDKIFNLIDHLTDNPLISHDDAGDYLQYLGTDIFKLGHSIEQKINPELKDYHIVFIPDELMDDIKDTLNDAQNRELKRKLDEELSKCANKDEEKIIQDAFNETVKSAQFKYVEPQI